MPKGRPKKPQLTISGIDLSVWQSETTMVRWAQVDPMFRTLLTVLINERARICNEVTGSENLKLGAYQCYDKVLDLFEKLAHGADKQQLIDEIMTYSSDEEISAHG